MKDLILIRDLRMGFGFGPVLLGLSFWNLLMFFKFTLLVKFISKVRWRVILRSRKNKIGQIKNTNL